MEKAIETQQEKAKGELSPLLLCDLVEEALAVQEEAIAQYGIRLERQYQYNDMVLAQQAVIIQILVNIIKNGIEAMYQSKHRVLTIETGISDEKVPYCRITDTGEGIADLSILFKRGMTTKEDGHGFGLNYCRKAMETMGGQLTATSRGVGMGADFTLHFSSQTLSS